VAETPVQSAPPAQRPRWPSNPWIRLLSLVLAICTWLYVQGEQIEEERVNAQIAWTLPEGLVSSDPLPTTAFLTVRGTRSAVNRAHNAMIRLVVDGSTLGEGEHSVELATIPPEGLPLSVERLAITPDTVQFVLEPVTERSVQIVPVLVGDPAQGYALGPVVTDPQVVQVRGPRSATSSLREVSTRPIDVSGLTEDTVREAPLDLPRSVERVGDQKVEARISVVSETEQRQVDDVPVYVWGLEGWKVDPPRVSVVLEGPTAKVRDIGARQIAAFVYLPNPPDRDRYEVWFGPTDGIRVEVLHPGAAGVSASSTTPPSVVVTRP
jgi:YbbR domain-containing protein